MLAIPQDKIHAYFKLSLLNGVVFSVLYSATNYYGTQTSDYYTFYFSWESAIPFYPSWIYIYLSIFFWFLTPLFLLDTSQLNRLSQSFLITTIIASLCFLIFPSESIFDRASQDYGGNVIYGLVYLLDKPHNLLPSLHVSYTTLFLFVFRKEGVRYFPFLCLWGAAMTVSVLFTHQHQLLDIAAGLLVGFFVYLFTYQRH
ncbi:MAG: phosphatase PAP2 family protein [Gammaproteobacteria bacterium]|jgi:hypothetical protein